MAPERSRRGRSRRDRILDSESRANVKKKKKKQKMNPPATSPLKLSRGTAPAVDNFLNRETAPATTYPLTRSQGAVAPAPAKTSEHENLGRPGRLVPRLIDDLLAGQFKTGEALSALSVGCRDPFPKASGSPQDIARHELLSIGHQCVLDERIGPEDGSGSIRSILSCICSRCRFHFVFTITRADNALSCSPKNNPDYFHHLVELSTQVTEPDNKYHPVIATAEFACSAANCRETHVKVEVSLPRLEARFIAYLKDEDRVVRRLRDAREAEPERFEDSPQWAPHAVALLRRYIKNIVERPPGSSDERKIDKRNKGFFIQFGNGDDCVELFKYLEFTELVYGQNNNEMWRVPVVEIVRPTPIGSGLAFFQDVQSELENILMTSEGSSAGPVLAPRAALPILKESLGMSGHYATTKFVGYDPADFETLGIPSDLHESMLWQAFGCQSQTDPANKLKYFQALTRVAFGRNHDDLNFKIATEESLMTAVPVGAVDDDEEMRRAKALSMEDQGSTGRENLAAAYKYFDFPQIPITPDVRVLLGRYEARIESAPVQKSEHREKLLVIFRALADKQRKEIGQIGDEVKKLKEVALGSMTVEEAQSYLEVTISSDDDSIISIADWQAGPTGERDPLLVATAVHTIAQARGSDVLRNAAIMIAAGLEDNYKDGRGTGVHEEAAANMNLPAGLENIRNTCYLNSILQYFFTVRTVREIVLDWDRYGLENTEEKLKARRIDPGSTRVERGEAYAGHQFALKLGDLFSELRTTTSRAVKPPQSLALVALKNSNQLEDDGAKLLAKEASQKKTDKDLPAVPPPLPVRSSPAPPVPPRPSQAPNVTVNAINDPEAAETSSTVSSQTLVNQAEDGSDAGYVSVTKPHGNAANSLGAGNSKESAIDVDMIDLVGTGDDASANHGGLGNGEASEVDASGDTVMGGAATEPQVTVEQKIAKALNDETTVGTDQQDVEEVMGNIIGHLRSSIKATGEDRDLNVQLDPVMDLFFWISATYSRKNGESEFRRIERTPNRWVTAYPDENGNVITLLQALDRNFQREYIQEGEDRYERFSSIVRLPPILHIHIQRSTKGQGKNNTAIAIPDRLYLDRFMDTDEDSMLFKKRQRSWNLNERLRSLDGPDGDATGKTDHGIDDEALADYDKDVMDAHSRQKGISEEVDGFTVITPTIKALLDQHGIPLPGASPQMDVDTVFSEEVTDENLHPDAVRRVVQQTARDEAAYRRELDGLFANETNEAYRLHAVICHAGSTGRSGHYWVWIFDFEKGVWRKYNDSSVTEEADAAKVLHQLSTAGEPYYLAYVRADRVAEMVDIPGREAPSTAAQDEDAFAVIQGVADAPHVGSDTA